MNKKEEIKLSQYAKEQNLPYKKIWNLYKAGGLSVETKVSESGRVSVLREIKANNDVKANDGKFATPLGTEGKTVKETVASRRNKAATSSPTDKFFFIESGITPFQTFNHDTYGSMINMGDILRLTQKAYWNFSIIRQVIDVMSEFSTNKIFLREGNKKSQQFFYNWMESVNILDLQDKFFRECYRSGNIFIYKLEAEINPADIKSLNITFGSKLNNEVKLPIKYIILNPSDINIQGGAMFSDSAYFKLLNSYEVARLKSPKTDGDKALLSSFDAKTQKDIKSGMGSVLLPLDANLIYAVFYKKQDYEPMSIPIIYPVLEDINWKSEMKHIDLAVSRVMQNVVLLVKMGYESKNGEYMFDMQAANAMKQLFESESVGKTLVADFTTEVEFKIPTIGDFLDPRKYEIVNEDIKTGLNFIFGGDSKFANQYIQVQLFIQRLQQARELFLTKFLIPEIKRISDIMNFKSYPIPYFEEIDLKDDTEFSRIVTRLAEIGLLTPEETFNAIETGRIPTGKESEESQENFVILKKKGYYEPIMGGPQSQMQLADKTAKNQIKTIEMQQEHDSKMKTKELKHKAENPEQPAPQIVLNAPTKMGQPKGKPTGKTGKNSKTRKSSPMKASEQYSLASIKDNIILAAELKDEIESQLLKKYKVKELSEEHNNTVKNIREIILANENPENWKSKVTDYIDNPINWNREKLNEIDEIAVEHSLDPFLSSILHASKKVDE